MRRSKLFDGEMFQQWVITMVIAPVVRVQVTGVIGEKRAGFRHVVEGLGILSAVARIADGEAG